jgi:hypothetical protein
METKQTMKQNDLKKQIELLNNSLGLFQISEGYQNRKRDGRKPHGKY